RDSRFPGHSIFSGEVRCGVAFSDRRRLGVELERAPMHLHLVGMAELAQRGFEATLADRAPRTHDIRENFDLHTRKNSRRRLNISHMPQSRSFSLGPCCARLLGCSWRDSLRWEVASS